MSFAALGIAGGTALAGPLGFGAVGTAAMGAGGGLLGGLLGGSLLGGLGGTSGSSPRLSQGNPAGTILGDLFGSQFSRHRGWIPNKRKPSVFRGLSGDISDYINAPLNRTGVEDYLYSDILGSSMMPQMFGESQALMDMASLNAALGAETGFNVDPSPLFSEAIRRFGAEALPSIAETSGLGLHSSGFRELAGREASNLLGQAATQGVQLQNDAAQRRMGAIPLLSQLAAGRLNLPLAFGGDVLGLGQQFRAEEERYARRPIDTFLALAGLGNSMPITQLGYPTQDTTSDLIGALGSSIPFLMQSILK